MLRDGADFLAGILSPERSKTTHISDLGGLPDSWVNRRVERRRTGTSSDQATSTPQLNPDALTHPGELRSARRSDSASSCSPVATLRRRAELKTQQRKV
jgi:hypothetical protein